MQKYPVKGNPLTIGIGAIFYPLTQNGLKNSVVYQSAHAW
jgi:hypothetical protein